MSTIPGNSIDQTPTSSRSARQSGRNNSRLRKRKGYSMMVDSSSIPSFGDPDSLQALSNSMFRDESFEKRSSSSAVGREVLQRPSASRSTDELVTQRSFQSSLSSTRPSTTSTPRRSITGFQLRNISPLFVDTATQRHRHTRHFSPSTPKSATAGNITHSLSGDEIPADTIKLLLLGDAGVGKTALILKYCNELQIRRKPMSYSAETQLLSQDIDVDDVTNNISQDFDSTLNNLENTPVNKSNNNNNNNNNNKTHDPRMRNVSANKTIKKLTRKQKCYSLSDYEELLSSSYDPRKNHNHRKQEKDKKTGSGDTNDSWNILNDYQSGDSDIDMDEQDEEDQWEISTETTVGIDIKTQLINLDNRYFKIVLWDTAGQERFRQSLNPLMYKKTQGLILVYDICSLDSFNSLMDYWIPEWIRNNGHSMSRCYLIGNKLDLYKKRQVTHEHVLKFVFEAENKYANQLCIGGNFEVSCKWLENNGVESSFSRIVQDLISHGCYDVVTKTERPTKVVRGDFKDTESDGEDVQHHYLDNVTDDDDDDDDDDKYSTPNAPQIVDLTKSTKYNPSDGDRGSGCCS
ncbi:hypothetical protein ACO0QE_000274 [Hanseniaspora vineae]